MENLMISLCKNNLLKNSDIRLSNIGWELGKIKLIRAGETIYSPGDNSSSVYLVIKGRILIIIKDKSENTQSIIFSNNDFFGAKELFSNISRCSEAVALSNSFLIELNREEIEYLTDKDDNIIYNLQKGNNDFRFNSAVRKNFREKYFGEINVGEYPNDESTFDPRGSIENRNSGVKKIVFH